MPTERGGRGESRAMDRVRVLGKSARSKHSATRCVTALSKQRSLTHSADNSAGMRPRRILDPSHGPGAQAAPPASGRRKEGGAGPRDSTPSNHSAPPPLSSRGLPPSRAPLWDWDPKPDSPGSSEDRSAVSPCAGNAGEAVGDVD